MADRVWRERHMSRRGAEGPSGIGSELRGWSGGQEKVKGEGEGVQDSRLGLGQAVSPQSTKLTIGNRGES